MTKKLSELFELPLADITTETENTETEFQLDEPVVSDATVTAVSTLEKIDEAMPRVRGLDATDTELDELSNLAKESYNELMNLGMQVDSRFASEIFAVAGTMLGHAITTKTAKINKKLKTLDLQLKQATLEAKQAQQNAQVNALPVGQGQNLGQLDRTELLKMIVGNMDTKSSKTDK